MPKIPKVDKCDYCPDKDHRDGYICENECPFEEGGVLKNKQCKRYVNGDIICDLTGARCLYPESDCADCVREDIS